MARIAGVDLPRDKRVEIGLTYIYGIGRTSATRILAEAGVNHNGDIDLAKKLIDVASEAGVDAVKFQTFKAEKLVSKNAKKAEYQIKNTEEKETQFDMIKRLELDEETHKKYVEDFIEQAGE